jgi:hypothetical protein
MPSFPPSILPFFGQNVAKHAPQECQTYPKRLSQSRASIRQLKRGAAVFAARRLRSGRSPWDRAVLESRGSTWSTSQSRRVQKSLHGVRLWRRPLSDNA